MQAWMTSNPGDLARPIMSRRVLASATRYSVICSRAPPEAQGGWWRAVARHQHAVEVLAEGLVSRGGADDADVVAVGEQRLRLGGDPPVLGHGGVLDEDEGPGAPVTPASREEPHHAPFPPGRPHIGVLVGDPIVPATSLCWYARPPQGLRGPRDQARGRVADRRARHVMSGVLAGDAIVRLLGVEAFEPEAVVEAAHAAGGALPEAAQPGARRVGAARPRRGRAARGPVRARALHALAVAARLLPGPARCCRPRPGRCCAAAWSAGRARPARSAGRSRTAS